MSLNEKKNFKWPWSWPNCFTFTNTSLLTFFNLYLIWTKNNISRLWLKCMMSLLTFLPVPQGEPGIPRPVQRSMRSGHWGQTGQGHCPQRSTISDKVVYRVLLNCHHIWTKWSNRNYGSYDVYNKFVSKNVLNLHSLNSNDSSCKYF